MRILLLALLLLGLLAILGALLDGAPAAADEGEIAGIDWLTDLEAARQQARESGRPILAVFR